MLLSFPAFQPHQWDPTGAEEGTGFEGEYDRCARQATHLSAVPCFQGGQDHPSHQSHPSHPEGSDAGHPMVT